MHSKFILRTKNYYPEMKAIFAYFPIFGAMKGIRCTQKIYIALISLYLRSEANLWISLSVYYIMLFYFCIQLNSTKYYSQNFSHYFIFSFYFVPVPVYSLSCIWLSLIFCMFLQVIFLATTSRWRMILSTGTVIIFIQTLGN